MSLGLQAKLLRVIEDGVIRRVGSTTTQVVDVRIIAASNVEPIKLLEEGKLRNDLYYRLNVIYFQVPLLRERREDIPILVDHFIDSCNKKMNKFVKGVDEEVMAYFYNNDWPGNVREIKNFAERLCVIAKKQNIQTEDIQNKIFYLEDKNINNREKEVVEDFFELEKEMIKCAIKKTHGNLSKAAVELGISRTTLWRKMKKYNIIVKV